ncbi:reverse transcriptase domain-containing protein [Tanacetum coccineum]
MIKSSNGDTPFMLTYGTEAVIPAEIGMPTLRTAEIDMVQNDEDLKINLDLLEERREQAVIREARSKAKMEKYYNSKVRNISFKPGDLVYRNNDAAMQRIAESLAQSGKDRTKLATFTNLFYTKMPFWRKNVGFTYQRLVDKAFDRQIGRNLEVYVDDLVIKSQSEDEVVRDIIETFCTLRKINMKLNPKKCIFGATEGMFLGHAISRDEIQSCSEKNQAVINMPSPQTSKEV